MRLLITAALILSSMAAFGCSPAQQLRGKIAGLKDMAAQAERNGARKCTPRALALTHAYIDFAERDLDRGSLSDARKHVAQAELNAHAAHLQSPPQFCTAQEAVAEAMPVPTIGDADGDGFLDPDDACPKAPENFNGFEDVDGCPDDPDSDGDGITDSVDACVILAEDVDQYLDADGCPEPDNDLDGVLDSADKCPIEGEDPDGYEDADGCPELDNDGDEVPDLTDECPNTPGQKVSAPLGCPLKPSLVVVTDCEVKITQQIHFATGKDIIRRDSYPIIDAVADVLEKNTSIKLEVQGHTDDVGSDKNNLDLSNRRAASVRKYLASRGIDPNRLESKGFGESSPIVENDSKDNRALNRRVQFMRIEGSKEGCPSGAPSSKESAN